MLNSGIRLVAGACAAMLASACGGGAASGPGASEAALTASDVERRAARWDDPSRDEWQQPDEVVRVLGLEPGMTVVDVGAGTGYLLSHLSRAVGAGGRVIALEVHPAMVEHMRARAASGNLTNVEVRLVDRDDPGLGNASADRIVVLDTWRHMRNRPGYARHLQQALRSGGSVVVIDHTEDSMHGPPQNARVAPHQVAMQLRHGGMTVQDVESSLRDQFVVRGSRE